MKMDTGHQESMENTLEYKSMDMEEGRSQWWKDYTSVKNTNSTCRPGRSTVCSVICITIPLFLILLILVSLKFNQQDSMLRELETKADNVASSLHSLPSKLQQTAPGSQKPDYKELTEVKGAVTNLGASITSLSSALHGTVEKGGFRLAVLEHSVTNLTQSLNVRSSGLQDTVEKEGRKMEHSVTNLTLSMNALSSGLQDTVSQLDTKMQKLETAMNSMSSSLESVASKMQQTVEKGGSRLAVLEHSVTNLTQSMNVRSSVLQDTVSQHDLWLQGLETAMSNMSSSLDTVPLKLQQTVEKEGRKMEHSVTNLTLSMNALSSGLQDTVSQQDTKMQKLETAMNSMSSSLESVASKMQQTDEKLMSTLNTMRAEIMSIKRSEDNPTYRCQNNWSLNASSCYLFSSNKLTWHEAGDYCRTQGASLLILNNAKEWDFITKHSVPEFYWVGLTDEITGKWAWVDGTPYVMDQSQWDVGQPDNWTKHGLGGGEDCAELAERGKLNDDHCTRQHKYICERAATGLQDTVSQLDTKMQKLETAMNSMSSSLESVASKMQQTDEKLTSMLNALSAEIMSIKRSKDNPTYRCQNNWSLNASSCYLFSSNKLTWHEAGDYCRTQGASLLILNNAKEWDFITQITVSEFYWVGLTDEITGKWAWVDGTPYVMDKSQWKVGQPDNWTKHGLGGGEDCAELAEGGKLNDDHCTRQRKYICERAATAD